MCDLFLYCRREMRIPSHQVNDAFRNAKRLDISNATIHGMYPYQWEVSDENTIIRHIGNQKKYIYKMLHLGGSVCIIHIETEPDTMDIREHDKAVQIFRAELLKVISIRYPVDLDLEKIISNDDDMKDLDETLDTNARG